LSPLIADTFNIDTPKKALIPFLTANFPTRQEFLDLLYALPKHGASIIEIGIPFSDPMADGPVIQHTSQHAIDQGFNLSECLDDIQAFKQMFPRVPIIIMTYANPLVRFGTDAFIEKATEAMVDGLLLVDVPPPMSIFKTIPNKLSLIRLITPTTSEHRIPIISSHASGFLYYVSVKGVTGEKAPDPLAVKTHIDTLKKRINLPIVIGFGINSMELAIQMGRISDGIVIGSAFLAPYLNSKKADYPSIRNQQLSFINRISIQLNNDAL
jgi:tryptophan synthase alpha chain